MTTSKTRWHLGLQAMPILIFVTLQALIVLIVHRHRTLWADEFNLLITVRRPFVEGLLQLQDYSAPLNQLILRPFVTNDTPPEWLLRAPTFAFSIASVVAAWYFVKALFSRRTAVIALLFIILNPVFALYSVQARPYMLFTFFSIISMRAFYSIVTTRPTSWNIGAYVLSSILLVYSHYYGFLVIAAQVVFAAVEFAGGRDRRIVPRLGWAFGSIGLATLPALWLISRYVRSGAAGAVGWISRPERTDLLFMRQAGALFGDEILCVVLLLAVVVTVSHGESDSRDVTGSPTWWRWWCERRAAMLCLLWIGFGLYFLLLVSYSVRPIYVARYGLPVEVPLAAFLGAALSRIKMPWLPLVVGALLTLPAARLFQRDLREDARDYTRLIETLHSEQVDPTSLFVGHLPYLEDFRNAEVYGLHYYGYDTDESELLLTMVRNPNGEIALRDGNILPQDRRVFVVTAVGESALEAYLQGEGRAYRRFEFGHLMLLELEKAGARGQWLADGRQSE